MLELRTRNLRPTLRAAALAALLPCAAIAHPGESSPIRAVVDAPAAGLDGITVQAHHTLAPQLVVENRGTRRLEILDGQGRAFLRIGPGGVQADLAAAAWYRTYTPAGLAAPGQAHNAGAPPQWTTVSARPAWGWFDDRIRIDADVERVARLSAEAADLGAWTVPVRVDGDATAITGRFRYEPWPAAPMRVHATPPAPLAGALQLRVVAGMPPAIFARNLSGQALTILGLDDEPYVRLSAAGAEVNLRSSTWRLWGRSGLPAPARGEPEGPRWHRVSADASYTWTEPRAQAAAGQRRDWSIPLEFAGQRLALRGYTDWTTLR